jgi:hypothetical protein
MSTSTNSLFSDLNLHSGVTNKRRLSRKVGHKTRRRLKSPLSSESFHGGKATVITNWDTVIGFFVLRARISNFKVKIQNYCHQCY